MKLISKQKVNYITNLPKGFKQMCIPNIEIRTYQEQGSELKCRAITLIEWEKIRQAIESEYPDFFASHSYSV